MGPHRTQGQHCTACAHNPTFIPSMRPSVPHLLCATHVSSHMRGNVCRVACERWGALGSGTWDDAWGHAHTPFPARVCDQGAVQRAHTQGGTIGKHVRSEGSMCTPLLCSCPPMHPPLCGLCHPPPHACPCMFTRLHHPHPPHLPCAPCPSRPNQARMQEGQVHPTSASASAQLYHLCLCKGAWEPHLST